MIFSDLKKKDLKNVRLVCSFWSHLTNQYLFERIYFSRWSIDVKVFRAWTSNPECAAAVKELIYDVTLQDTDMSLLGYSQALWFYLRGNGSLLPNVNLQGSSRQIQEICHHAKTGRSLKPDESFVWPPGCPEGCDNDWNLSKTTCFDDPLVASFMSYPLVSEGYHEYITQARSAYDLEASGRLLIALTSGLKRLPNLKSISLWESNECVHKFDPILLLPRCKSGPPSLRKRHPMYLPPTCPYKPRSFLGPTERDRSIADLENAYYLQFANLFHALSKCHSQLNRLQLRYVDWDRFIDNVFPSVGSSGLLEADQINVAFGSLKTIDVTIGEKLSWPGEKRDFRGFIQCLKACKNLEELVLTDCEYPCFPKSTSAQPILPRLHKLVIIHGTLDGRVLAAFISQYDLQQLELYYVYLEEPAAAPILDTFSRAIARVPRVHIIHSHRRCRKQDAGNGSKPEIHIDVCGTDIRPKVRRRKGKKIKWLRTGDWSSSVMNRQPWSFDTGGVRRSAEFLLCSRLT